MDIEELREYCLAKTAVTEDFPFGPDTLVFRVGEKLFVLTNLEAHPPRFNAKCDPDRAVELRAEYPAVVPGYHMNKKHWNTITLDGSMPSALVRELVDHSYDLVAGSLTRKRRAELGIV